MTPDDRPTRGLSWTPRRVNRTDVFGGNVLRIFMVVINPPLKNCLEDWSPKNLLPTSQNCTELRGGKGLSSWFDRFLAAA